MKRIKVRQGYLAKKTPKPAQYYDQGINPYRPMPPRTPLMQNYGKTSKKQQEMQLLQMYLALAAQNSQPKTFTERAKDVWNAVKETGANVAKRIDDDTGNVISTGYKKLFPPDSEETAYDAWATTAPRDEEQEDEKEDEKDDDEKEEDDELIITGVDKPKEPILPVRGQKLVPARGNEIVVDLSPQTGYIPYASSWHRATGARLKPMEVKLRVKPRDVYPTFEIIDLPNLQPAFQLTRTSRPTLMPVPTINEANTELEKQKNAVAEQRFDETEGKMRHETEKTQKLNDTLVDGVVDGKKLETSGRKHPLEFTFRDKKTGETIASRQHDIAQSRLDHYFANFDPFIQYIARMVEPGRKFNVTKKSMKNILANIDVYEQYLDPLADERILKAFKRQVKAANLEEQVAFLFSDFYTIDSFLKEIKEKNEAVMSAENWSKLDDQMDRIHAKLQTYFGNEFDPAVLLFNTSQQPIIDW